MPSHIATGKQVLTCEPTSWNPGSQVKVHSVSMVGWSWEHCTVPLAGACSAWHDFTVQWMKIIINIEIIDWYHELLQWGRGIRSVVDTDWHNVHHHRSTPRPRHTAGWRSPAECSQGCSGCHMLRSPHCHMSCAQSTHSEVAQVLGTASLVVEQAVWEIK